MFKLIFFDCDGVLALGNSWVNLHKIAGLSKGLDQKLYTEYAEGKISVYDWTKKIEQIYKLHKFTRNSLQKVISTIKINPEAKDLIAFLHLKNIPIAMVSGSFDIYAKYVADTLRIPIWRSNYSFSFNKNGSLLRINTLGDEKTTKVNEVKDICKLKSIDPEETLFIGDSFNDVEAFKLTKRGLLYKSDKLELEKNAWKKISHLQDVKSLL